MTGKKKGGRRRAASTSGAARPAGKKTRTPSKAEMERRGAWFEDYCERLEKKSVRKGPAGTRYACPCCGFKALLERGRFDICPVCYWEDDGQDEEDADVVRGGPNGALSLTQARKNFEKFGASDRRMLPEVRAPKPEERPERAAKQPRVPMAHVHVFGCSGRFGSFEEMRAFIDQTYTEDGDGIPSAFMREVALSGYEPGCIEAIHSKKPKRLATLLKGVSYTEQWLSQLSTSDQVDAAICVFEPNIPARPERSSLTYYGSFEYRA